MKNKVILDILTYCINTFTQTFIVPPSPTYLSTISHHTQSNYYNIEIREVAIHAIYPTSFIKRTIII